jgi:hypothetical protein
MSQHQLEFSINDTNKIIIDLAEPLGKVHCCYEVPILLIHENKTFDLGNYSVREYANDLKNIAKKIVANELQLHESITKDIGFLLNEALQYKSGLFEVPNGSSTWWVGYQYCLSMCGKVALWFYSDTPDGRIIFEATPIFPFSYRNYDKDPNYISYRKWMKTYKPYFIAEASMSCIKQWIGQANIILEQIEKNIAREHKMFHNALGKVIYNAWCDILKKEYGINDPGGSEADKVPAEFQTDEWWKKRGL